MMDLSGFKDLGKSMEGVYRQLNSSIVEIQKLRDNAKNHATPEQLAEMDNQIIEINKQKDILNGLNNNK